MNYLWYGYVEAQFGEDMSEDDDSEMYLRQFLKISCFLVLKFEVLRSYKVI